MWGGYQAQVFTVQTVLYWMHLDKMQVNTLKGLVFIFQP